MNLAVIPKKQIQSVENLTKTKKRLDPSESESASGSCKGCNKGQGQRDKRKSEGLPSNRLSKSSQKRKQLKKRSHSMHSKTSDSDSEEGGKFKSTHMKPHKFDGKGVFADFLSQFEACRDYNRWSEKEAAYQLFSCCQGDSLNRLTTDGVTPQTSTYSELVEVLEREFGPRECKSSYIMELNQVKQRPGESARELGNRIKKLASLAFRGKDKGSKKTREEMSLNSFTLALSRKDIRDAVFGAEFSNLKQAIDKAEYLESYHKRDENEQEMTVRRREKHVSFVRKLEVTESESEIEDRIVQRVLSDKCAHSH